MSYGVVIPNKIRATDVDALVRTAYNASTDIENGMVFELLTQSTGTGLGEVWLATECGAITNLWMAYSPEIVTVTSGSNSFRGLDADPRNFLNLKGLPFDAFKPQIGDIITLTGDVLDSGSGVGSTYVIAGSSWQLAWSNSPASGLTLTYLTASTPILSIPTGTISDTQRVTAYKFQVTVIS